MQQEKGRKSRAEDVDLFEKKNFGQTTPTDPEPEPGIPGDTNSDGAVDLVDFNSLKNAFGIGDSLQEGDFNGDGVVDLTDFDSLKQNFGTSASVSVPEPSTWMLSVLAVLGVLSIWRPRNRRY